jgi:hypothetical protein
MVNRGLSEPVSVMAVSASTTAKDPPAVLLARSVQLVRFPLSWMEADIHSAWTGLATLIMASRDRSGPKSKVQTHYYIRSLKDERAGRLQTYIHNHWAIEHSRH